MSKRTWAKLLFIASLVCLSACKRHTAPSVDNPVGAKIDQIIKAFPENTTLGIMVQNLETGETLYELNPTRSFVPASVLKVLTATVALDYLGPDFRYTTLLATDKPAKDTLLPGNLYIDFSGDPSLKSQQLIELLASLKQKNIQEINGNIIIDQFPFTSETAGPGFMWDDENVCYAALANGVILDRNCFKFQLYPNARLQEKAILINHSPLEFTPVHNSVMTELSSEDECYQTLASTPDNHYELTGCIPYNAEKIKYEVAIRNPNLYAIQIIKAALASQHIKLRGSILFGRTPANATILAVHQSEPLAKMIKHMLTKSDNLYANSLFKTIGAIYTNSEANWKNGAEAMLAILSQMHIDTTYTIIADGAGLSRYNRLTPKTVLDAFNFNYHHPNFTPVFINSLAHSGQVGTLRSFTLDKNNAQFLGKTGSMKNIKGIAGVLTAPNKPPILFIMLVNGSSSTRDYTKLANSILNELNN